ncbi:MAG: hypothetical protein LBC30_04540, partial [Puniceicoccales bacterium]|nr:hypothetical protein [Puniceicoccales bacterium]
MLCLTAPYLGSVAGPGDMVGRPRVRFQRDLSSFPGQRGKSFGSDNQAIAIDVKSALAMGIAAAGVERSIFAELLGSKVDLIVKYNKFVSEVEKFVKETDPLDFEVFKKLNDRLTMDLRQDTSIGTLIGNQEVFRKIDMPNIPKRTPGMSDEDWRRKLSDYKNAGEACVAQNKEQFMKNLKASWDVIDKNFRQGEVHPMQQDIRAVQFIAELSVYLLLDLKSLENMPNETTQTQARALLERLNTEAIKGNTKDLTFAQKLVNSAYFMEFKLKPVDDKICDAIGSVLTQLDQLNPPLTFGERTVIIDAMKAKLEASRKANFGEEGEAFGVSGVRGRSRAHSGDQAQFYSNREKPIPSFAASRCSDIDMEFLEQKKITERQTTGSTETNPGPQERFLNAMAKNRAFIQENQMATQTANAQILPQNRIDILNDPIKFLRNALKATGIINARKKDIKRCIDERFELREDMESEARTEIEGAVHGLKDELLSIKFKDEQKREKRISDLVEINGREITSLPSAGSLIKDAGLRTICSISGSAAGMIAGLCAHIGEAKTKAILQSLRDFVDGDCTDPRQLSNDFKRLFLAASLYMQAGQYHSAAEVLESLYASAVILNEGDEDSKGFDRNIPQIRRMLAAFRELPENFFPLSDADKERLNAQAPGIIKELQRQHNQTIAGRKEQGMETLEKVNMARSPKLQRPPDKKRASE